MTRSARTFRTSSWVRCRWSSSGASRSAIEGDPMTTSDPLTLTDLDRTRNWDYDPQGSLNSGKLRADNSGMSRSEALRSGIPIPSPDRLLHGRCSNIARRDGGVQRIVPADVGQSLNDQLGRRAIGVAMVTVRTWSSQMHIHRLKASRGIHCRNGIGCSRQCETRSVTTPYIHRTTVAMVTANHWCTTHSSPSAHAKHLAAQRDTPPKKTEGYPPNAARRTSRDFFSRVEILADERRITLRTTWK